VAFGLEEKPAIVRMPGSTGMDEPEVGIPAMGGAA